VTSGVETDVGRSKREKNLKKICAGNQRATKNVELLTVFDGEDIVTDASYLSVTRFFLLVHFDNR
jgi:hypothetical protein